MKFLAAVAAVAVAAVASAQQIQISNPTEGTVWVAGDKGYISWSGNCASAGNNSRAVDIQLVNGPSTAVRFVADLGQLDCSGTTMSITIPVPTTVQSGTYSLRVLTSPQPSYSTAFQIQNAASPAPTTTTTSAPLPTNAPASAGNSLTASVVVAAMGVAAAAIQFVF
ncbi:hypothetical protein B0O80DRAFT_465547 [Mortierella sp. GBAus27b]|nr:hypothetical protein B0O80DRAFT_465547 [Mortierella sp. GBAus27b]